MLFMGHIILPGQFSGYQKITIHTPPTELFTMIFNTFLLMTLFNEVNCRKVHGEMNVFKGILSNPIFYIIWITTFLSQILIVQFGGDVFFTTPISLAQWAVCLGCAVGVLVWHQMGLLLGKVIMKTSKEEGRR